MKLAFVEFENFLRHGFGLEDQIDHTSLYRAVGHAAKRRRLLVLRQGKTTVILDGFESGRTVVAGTRQYNRDGVCLVYFCE